MTQKVLLSFFSSLLLESSFALSSCVPVVNPSLAETPGPEVPHTDVIDKSHIRLQSSSAIPGQEVIISEVNDTDLNIIVTFQDGSSMPVYNRKLSETTVGFRVPMVPGGPDSEEVVSINAESGSQVVKIGLLRILPLPPAKGTLDSLKADLATIQPNLPEFFSQDPAKLPQKQQALAEVYQEIYSPKNPNSLISLLEGNAEVLNAKNVDHKLVENLLASTGLKQDLNNLIVNLKYLSEFSEKNSTFSVSDNTASMTPSHLIASYKLGKQAKEFVDNAKMIINNMSVAASIVAINPMAATVLCVSSLILNQVIDKVAQSMAFEISQLSSTVSSKDLKPGQTANWKASLSANKNGAKFTYGDLYALLLGLIEMGAHASGNMQWGIVRKSGDVIPFGKLYYARKTLIRQVAELAKSLSSSPIYTAANNTLGLVSQGIENLQGYIEDGNGSLTARLATTIYESPSVSYGAIDMTELCTATISNPEIAEVSLGKIVPKQIGSAYVEIKLMADLGDDLNTSSWFSHHKETRSTIFNITVAEPKSDCIKTTAETSECTLPEPDTKPVIKPDLPPIPPPVAVVPSNIDAVTALGMRGNSATSDPFGANDVWIEVKGTGRQNPNVHIKVIGRTGKTTESQVDLPYNLPDGKGRWSCPFVLSGWMPLPEEPVQVVVDGFTAPIWYFPHERFDQ